MSLDTPLTSLSRIGPKFSKKLEKLGLKTVGDLLFFFPTRYEDLSHITKIDEITPGADYVVQGVIIRSHTHRSFKKHMAITEIVVEDESGAIKAIWFNQPYIGKALAEGAMVNLAGKVAEDQHGMYLSNPLYELIGAPMRDTTHTGRIIPIYRETKGITSKAIRYFLSSLLEWVKELPEYIPHEILTRNNIPLLKDALYAIHYPKTLEEASHAHQRFIFEHLFLVSLAREQRKKENYNSGVPLTIHLEEIKQFIDTLPFTLTEAQKRATWTMLKNTGEATPMQRLLNGDVGSGKTVVSAILALNTVLNKRQIIIMAPTEILARQHFETFIRLFQAYPIAIGLIAGKKYHYAFEGLSSETQKPILLKSIRSGKINIVIGTHALLEKEVVLAHPALIVIDEQHRFGVEQRAILTRDKHVVHPHVLSMTATPIPRTLALTVFGDMDISVLDEMPKGRKKITTKIVSPENRMQAYEFVRSQVKKGFQAFVICPRIETSAPSEDIKKLPTQQKMLWWEVKTVKDEHEKLQSLIFPDLKVGILHGKMKSDEKEAIMKAFAEKSVDILVSTSVVEVGVDIPNATVMLIESAERFGLAQLHQFRGRIGRNEHQSYCLLFTTSVVHLEERRLKAMTTTHSGFELAEMDLRLRGPGEFLGEEQSGWSDIVMSTLKNPALLAIAEEEAKLFLTHHTITEIPALHEKLESFTSKLHLA
ncbi:MAG: ATP-dependent DNA helicase RecG [Parcubacteria group bacterium]|nr:ATP-dependent DNA helicase RecG [Parcubacteria group bacterium]